MPSPPDARVFARVPDSPQHIDTRGILLSGRAHIEARPGADLSRDGFLVVLPWRAVISVVGAPDAELIARTAASIEGDVNVLAEQGQAEVVSAALPRWTQQAAVLHTLPHDVAWRDDSEPETTIVTRDILPPLEHVPEKLRTELLAALDGRPTTRFVSGRLPADAARPDTRSVPAAAAWAEGRAVAFCYPVVETEGWWDVSVDTLDAWRGRGLAGRAARAMIREMWTRGKSPVWGALESNSASRRLAARLGFQEIGRLAVFTSRRQGP